MTLIQRLRKKYKPRKIKYLLIAESPPECIGDNTRFFYNEKQDKYDFLFKSIMACLFLNFETNYKKEDKDKYLEKFKNAGFFLIDASDEPLNDLSEIDRKKRILLKIKRKIKEIENLKSEETLIFLIKKNIYNIFNCRLKDMGYNVVNNKFLPFPCCGHQKEFKMKFKKYLHQLNIYEHLNA